MTNEEALKYHKANWQAFVDLMWDGNENSNPYDEAFRMAIEAIEKQIPKKPIFEYQNKGYCPGCGSCLPYSEFTDGEKRMYHINNCWDCGQRLD